MISRTSNKKGEKLNRKGCQNKYIVIGELAVVSYEYVRVECVKVFDIKKNIYV